MRRSTYRRAATRPRFDRRLLGAAAALVVFGALIGVTQISNADDNSGPERVNGLEILANDCSQTELEPHDGFQKGERCVSTEFGEVAAAEKNPTLLITEAPTSVAAGQPFRLKVSTRNLVRDRFLAAGQGGYYVESSVLTEEGLVRGHFHTACRMLESTDEAVDPAPVPAFFVATEDSRGGAEPDEVTIEVPGMPEAGVAQCASWAGDGSHRIPMMERANQTPAIDAVRIEIRRGQDDEPPADDNEPPADDNEPPADDNGNEPPADDNDNGNEPPADDNGNEPPADDNDNEPPADDNDNGNPPASDGDDAPAPNSGEPTTKTTTKPAPPADSSGEKADEKAEEEADQEAQADKPKPAVTTKAAQPKPSKSSKAAQLQAQSDDDDADLAADDVEAAPAPAEESGSNLALTGANTIAIAGIGVLLILGGAMLFGSMRRRRAGSGWR